MRGNTGLRLRGQHDDDENPKPTKVFRIVDLGNKDDHKMGFLGMGRGLVAHRCPTIFLDRYLARRQGNFSAAFASWREALHAKAAHVL